MVRVLLVDDDADMLTFLSAWLDLQCPDVTVVGEASDFQQAMTMWRTLTPDVVISDWRLASQTCADLFAAAVDERPGGRVIIYSGDANVVHQERARGRTAILKPGLRALEAALSATHAARSE